MVNNVINIKTLMKENTPFNVSRNAIDEMRGQLEAQMEIIMSDLTKLAKENKTKTIMGSDVVRYFGFTKNKLYSTG